MSNFKLIKYCDEKHHPKNCDTIQFGTLEYFRKSDNKFIADPSEGQGSNYIFRNNEQDISFSKEELGWISNGGIIGSGVNITKGGTMRLNQKIEVPNCYIFCCSIIKEPTTEKIESQMKDLGYNSWYEITKPKEFIHEAFKEASSKIKLQLKKDCKIEWECLGKEIEYGRKDNLEFSSHIDFLDFLLYRKPLVSQVNKDIEYWKNTEFRFTWLFFEKASILPVPVEIEPIIFSNEKLKKYFK